MSPRKWIKNREIEWETTQTRRRKHQNLETNHTRKTLDNKRRNKRNILDYETELRRCFENRLDRLNEMGNEQRDNNRTPRMTERIRTDLSVQENEIIIKKKRSELRHNIKETKTKIISFNIHEIWETVVYKRLPR